MQNWKTSLFGLGVIIITALGPVLGHCHPIVGMSWVAVMTSIAGLLTGGGLIVAKDYSTHSTEAQVQASTAVITNAPNAPALVKAADAQVAAKK